MAYIFDDEDTSLMNINDDLPSSFFDSHDEMHDEPSRAGKNSGAKGVDTSAPSSNNPFSVDSLLDYGVDKLKEVTSATLQEPDSESFSSSCAPNKQHRENASAKSQHSKGATHKKHINDTHNSTQHSKVQPVKQDEYESSISNGKSRKRRRKISAEELREKNRIYAKNHRAEKKRRQEELVKRNEQLEKENRHLRRMLMQLGLNPNGSGFKTAQTIRNVGNSLVKGVKGGIGFMMPNNNANSPNAQSDHQNMRQGPPEESTFMLSPQGPQFTRVSPNMTMPPNMNGQFIIPPHPIVINQSGENNQGNSSNDCGQDAKANKE